MFERNALIRRPFAQSKEQESPGLACLVKHYARGPLAGRLGMVRTKEEGARMRIMGVG